VDTTVAQHQLPLLLDSAQRLLASIVIIEHPKIAPSWPVVPLPTHKKEVRFPGQYFAL
jgi:hypothetical protein